MGDEEEMETFMQSLGFVASTEGEEYKFEQVSHLLALHVMFELMDVESEEELGSHQAMELQKLKKVKIAQPGALALKQVAGILPFQLRKHTLTKDRGKIVSAT